MKKTVIIILLLITIKGIAQNPNFQIDPGNKFINFKKAIINDDFFNVSQLRIGTYMTLGNYGNTNGSWIGSNAILDYSSYGDRGSLGNKNLFIPAWNQGTALVISPNFVDGNFTGYTHDWNQSSNRVDIKDFTTSWNLGPEKTYFNSNVGIGTTSPTEKLQINGNIMTYEGNILLNNSSTNQDNSGLIRWNEYSNDNSNKSGAFIRYNGNGNYLQFMTNNETTDYEHLRINRGGNLLIQPTSGNVGIGTTTPDAKLAVNGNIHTKEVKVDLVGWPDYVFENDYQLPTLQEVENHIAEKGHLENIPSAAEVAENGIQLGEMNAKLLQKIEELTLYMIEQNKKTDNLIKEVKALKQKNAELEKKMK